MKRTLIIIIGVLSMFFIALAGVSMAADEKPVAKPKPLDVGDAVSDFSLPGLDGQSVSFDKDIKGKKDLAVIVFMTTACSACQGEIAAINDMLGKFGSKVGLYAVAVDIRGVDTVKPYAETYSYKATYLLDQKFSLPRVFGFSYTPSVAMIDKGGKLLFKKGGYAPGDEDMLQEKIMSYLKK